MASSSTGPGRITIGLLAGFAALAPMSIDMYLPALPTISAQLDATPAAATATLSLFFIGLAAGQLIIGPISDRAGRRPPLIIGLAIFTLSTALAATSATVGQLIAARLAQGLSGAAVTVSGRAIVRDMFDHRGTARFLSMLMLISGLAPVLAPSLGSALLSAGSWRLIFMVTAVVGLIFLIGTVLALPETRHHQARMEARQDHPLRGYVRLLSERRLLGYLFTAAFNSACFFTYLASAPLVLMQVYGFKPWAFSLIMAVNAVGLVGASQLNRWLLRSRQPDQLLRVSARNSILLAVPFFAFAATMTGGLFVLLPLVFAVVASNSVIQTNTMAGALSVDPTRSGSIAALFGAIGFGAGTLCSFIAGLLFDGTPRGMMAMIGVGLVGTALAIRMIRTSAEDTAAETSAA